MRASPQRGVALLAVLWLVAALSIMLGGLQQVVRGEIRFASQARHGVISNSLGDAAIRLTLQDMATEKNKPIQAIQTKTVAIFGATLSVQITPLNGRIDLNNASQALLADTFEYLGQLSKPDAQRLANAAIETRAIKNSNGSVQGFHAVEDLLRVPGIGFDAYAKIKNCLTTDLLGSGRVNPLAASLETLIVLTQGNRARAQQLFESRRSTPESMDTTTLTAAHIQIASTNKLSISATTTLPDNTRLVRTWRVDTTTPTHGLPWRILGIDPSVAPDAVQVQ